MSQIFLSAKKLDSKSELIGELKSSKVETILLGENAQQYVEFIEIKVKETFELREILKIGIISEGHGLKPQYIIIKLDKILIGFNKEICLIPVSSINKVITREFDSLFYEFKYIKNLDRILVVCEAEVLCLSSTLDIVWEAYSDLIIDFEITEAYLKIITEAGKRLLSLVDGGEI